jgi:hypothetical protein
MFAIIFLLSRENIQLMDWAAKELSPPTAKIQVLNV